MMAAAAASAEAPLTLTATTTGAAESVTIARMTLRVASRIDWGDGTYTEMTANDEAPKLHTYAVAGTYRVAVFRVGDVTQVQLDSAKIGGLNTQQLRRSPIVYFWVTAITGSAIDSADMAGWTPTNWQLRSMPAGTYSIDSADMAGWTPTYWRLYSMPAGTYSIDSADMVGWTPTNWLLYSMPAGTYSIDSADMVGWTPTTWHLYSMPAGTYSIDSADMVGWTPTYWHLYSMPAGTYSIDSADMAGWTPTYWRLYSMPAAGSSYTFGAAIMRNWTSAASIACQDLALLVGVVDAILLDIYTGRAGYTNAAPVLNVGGSNAAPSGVYQDAAPPTTGLEYKYKLVVDPDAEGFNKWAITS